MEHTPFDKTKDCNSHVFHVNVCGLSGVSGKIDTTVRIIVANTTSNRVIDFYYGFSDNFLSFAFSLDSINSPWINKLTSDELIQKIEVLLPSYVSSLLFRWDEILVTHKEIVDFYHLTRHEESLLNLYTEICLQYRSWYTNKELAFSISDEYQVPGLSSDNAYINAYLEHSDEKIIFCFGICDYLPEDEHEFLTISYQISEHIDLFQSPFYLVNYVKNFWNDQIENGLSWDFIKHQIHANSTSKASTITLDL